MSAIELLQELLRVDTTNPPGNETDAAEILHARLTAGGVKTEIVTSPAGRATVIGRVPGPPDARPLVLLSHLDVVGVEEERWSHDPFGGEIYGSYIWGRGALDMKGITAMHATAVMDLAAAQTDTTREVICVAVADEETGGAEGARWLLEHHAESVGFGDTNPPPEVVGEGAYGLSDVLDRPLVPIVLGEKSALWVKLIARGDPGHGALPPQNQAALNLARAITKVAGYGAPRIHPVMREQFRILADDAAQPLAAALKVLSTPAGAAIVRALKARLSRTALATLLSDTVATTQLSGGYKHNVIPGEAWAALDCRLLPDTDIDGFVTEMQERVARHSVEVEEVSRNSGPVSDPGPLFPILQHASKELEPDAYVVPSLTAGLTDIRFFRSRGAIGYGWVPLMLTPELLGTIHGHDERVEVTALERAARTMSDVVSAAATPPS